MKKNVFIGEITNIENLEDGIYVYSLGGLLKLFEVDSKTAKFIKPGDWIEYTEKTDENFGLFEFVDNKSLLIRKKVISKQNELLEVGERLQFFETCKHNNGICHLIYNQGGDNCKLQTVTAIQPYLNNVDDYFYLGKEQIFIISHTDGVWGLIKSFSYSEV